MDMRALRGRVIKFSVDGPGCVRGDRFDAPRAPVAPTLTLPPPSIQAIPSDTEPQSNLFAELPQRRVGETAQAEGFKITLQEAQVVDGKLRLVLELSNTSPYQVDLNEAIQLRDSKGRLLSSDPAGAPKTLGKSAQVEGAWEYSLSPGTASVSAWRLIYAPRGWSGPVFVYRLE